VIDGNIRASSFGDLAVHELHDILRLRVDVFVVEQGCLYPELDGLDPISEHVWVERNDRILSYMRLIPGDDVTTIGRVVTAPSERGSGLARAMLDHVLMRPGPWKLEAQSYLENWYTGFGFERSGPELLLDGIAHVPMVRA